MQPPSPSLVERALAPVDYSDVYSLDVAHGTFGDVDALARAATQLSVTGKALMATRDFVVRPFGLITVPEQLPASSAPINVGSALGIFKVIARSEDEILMGLDDKHLDFRFSLMLRVSAQGERAIATTLVRFNNAGGRIYFAFVKPVHRWIVPGMLRIAASRARRSQHT